MVISLKEKNTKKGIDMEIEEIEGRTQEDVINILKRHGLGKIRRKKWLDYQEAKKVCFEGQLIHAQIYDRQIGWICNYLKL